MRAEALFVKDKLSEVNSPPPVSAGQPAGQAHCADCGDALPASGDCETCGVEHYWVCECGAQVPEGETHCDECGLPPPTGVRISRRRSRSTRVRPLRLLRSAGLGAFFAVIAAAFINSIITRIASVGLYGQEAQDLSFMERLARVVDLLTTGFVRFYLLSREHNLGAVLMVGLLGALAGGVWYVLQTHWGGGTSRRRKSKSSPQKRRRA